MNIVIYSNCQANGILYYLKKKYSEGIYTIISNYKYIESREQLPLTILNNADVFIFTFVKKEHGIYSTDPLSDTNIFSLLKKDCILFGFASLFMSALWCVTPPGGSVTCGQEIIKEYKKKYSLSVILDLYDKNLLFFNMEERFNKCLQHTIDHEYIYTNNINHNINIILVSEFILKYYKEHNLFITHCHPSSYIFVYIVNIILQKLNINNLYILFESKYDEGVNGGNFPHSKYDIKELNLNYVKNNDINENYTKNSIIEIYNK